MGLVGWSNITMAQFGSRSAACGNLYVGANDMFSAINNLASLAELGGFSAGIDTYQPFILSGLNAMAAALVFPVGSGNTGVYLQTFGNSYYRESKMKLAYALPLSPELKVGVGLNYMTLQLGEGLGSASSFFPEVGMLFKPRESFTIGLHLSHLTLGTNPFPFDELRGPGAHAALNYQINDNLRLGLQANLVILDPFSINSGLEYTFSKRMALRIGYQSYPQSLSFGFGVRLNRVHFDLASTYHQILGFTPAVSIYFQNEK